MMINKVVQLEKKRVMKVEAWRVMQRVCIHFPLISIFFTKQGPKKGTCVGFETFFQGLDI